MKLDPHQEAARTNQDAKVLLVAPPGSGKTTVLLAKIDHLIEDCGVAPERILVLTFSRSASDNMKSRHQSRRSGSSPGFGTLHAFAWQEIRKARGKLQLISHGQAMTALQPVRRQYFLSAEEIQRALGSLSRQRATGRGDESFPEKLTQRIRTDYEAFKASHGLIDFDDLEDELLDLLADETRAAQVQQRYDWIMVDEFQDLNPKQIRILKILAGSARLFCVGDEDQCIYAFRGSDSSAMVHFGDLFPGGRILYLVYNFRCSATIVRRANRLIRNNQARYPKQIVNFRQDETAMRILELPDEDHQQAFAVDRARDLDPKETLCFILRTNGEVQELAQGLIRRGIRFSLLDRLYNPYDRPILRQMIGWLAYAAARRPDRARFLRIAPSLPIRFPPDVLTRLAMASTATEGDLLDLETFGCPSACRIETSAFFRGMDQAARMDPRSAVRFCLYVLGYHRYLEAAAARSGQPLRDLIDEIETLAREAGAFPDLATYLRYIQTWDDLLARTGPPERILLSTMHGVKGMEFDEVVIANACDGYIPHERSLDDLEAERRLFYVAITRARDRLIITVPRSIQGRPAKPSRFLEELELPLETALPRDPDRSWRLLRRWLGRDGRSDGFGASPV